MDRDDVISMLETIVIREQNDGCPMADTSLIEPALRRWKTYERRFKKHRDKSLEHRAHDLEKAFIELYPDSYDPGCVRHLAQSFAEFLISVDVSAISRHKKSS